MEQVVAPIRKALEGALPDGLSWTAREVEGMLRIRVVGWKRKHTVQVSMLNRVRGQLNDVAWDFGKQRWTLLRWVSWAAVSVASKRVDVTKCDPGAIRVVPARIDFWFGIEGEEYPEDPEEQRLVEGYPAFRMDEKMNQEDEEKLKAALVVANTKKGKKIQRQLYLESMLKRKVDKMDSPRLLALADTGGPPEFTYADIDELDLYLRYLRGDHSPSRVPVTLTMDRTSPEQGPTLTAQVSPYPRLSDTNFAFFDWLYGRYVAFTLTPLTGALTAQCTPTLW